MEMLDLGSNYRTSGDWLCERSEQIGRGYTLWVGYYQVDLASHVTVTL